MKTPHLFPLSGELQKEDQPINRAFVRVSYDFDFEEHEFDLLQSIGDILRVERDVRVEGVYRVTGPGLKGSRATLHFFYFLDKVEWPRSRRLLNV